MSLLLPGHVHKEEHNNGTDPPTTGGAEGGDRRRCDAERLSEYYGRQLRHGGAEAQRRSVTAVHCVAINSQHPRNRASLQRRRVGRHDHWQPHPAPNRRAVPNRWLQRSAGRHPRHV